MLVRATYCERDIKIIQVQDTKSKFILCLVTVQNNLRYFDPLYYRSCISISIYLFSEDRYQQVIDLLVS